MNVARNMNSGAYRAAFGLALAGALLVLWVQAAVTTEDDSPGLVFFGVLAVGVVGALIARFRPAGMARALFATAIAQALLAVGAMVAWEQYLEIAILNGVFLALWIGSALLFRKAARVTL
jgi:hypothetical protein